MSITGSRGRGGGLKAYRGGEGHHTSTTFNLGLNLALLSILPKLYKGVRGRGGGGGGVRVGVGAV